MRALWVAWSVAVGVLIVAWVFVLLTIAEMAGGGWRGWTGVAILTFGVMGWTFSIYKLTKPKAVPDA